VTTSREGSRRLSRDVAASAAGAGIYSLSLGIASVALPLLILRAGYSATEVGILTAVAALSQMVTRMALGAVMRRYADWTLIASAGLLLALSNGIAAYSAALAPLLLAELTQGVARACFWTGSQTHAVRGPGRAARALAIVNLASSSGLLVGPVVAGLLSERAPMLALALAAVIALIGAVPAFMLDRLPPFVPPQNRPPGRLWRRPGVDIGCWAGVTAGAWRAILTSYVPVALDQGRQSASTIGALTSLANGAYLVGSAASGRVRGRWATPLVLSSIVLTGVATAATGAFASYTGLAATVLIISGLAAGPLHVLGPAIASESVHDQERGEAIAVSGTFRAAALFGAPLAVAGLVAVIPLAPAMAVVGAAMTVPAARLRRHVRWRGASS
jgi:predicted MFS family arabinose efflux permease